MYLAELAEQEGAQVASAWWEGDVLKVRKQPRCEPFITLTCDIGPGPELTAERQRFLSVLEARP